MNQENRNEIWQVEVGGQIYEAPLAELPEWIGEGSLQPSDKVRKGNLRWIEARKVPALIPFFNARERGEPMPVVQSITDASTQAEPSVQVHAGVNGAENYTSDTRPAAPAAASARHNFSSGAAVPGQCAHHTDRPTAYICSACGHELCKACPTSYGGNVRICPDCGSLCGSAAEAAMQSKRSAVETGIGSEPFGFSDFGRALAHPFKFGASLFLGGLMFMFFSIGQSAASFGSFFLIGAAIICFMLTNMIVFGIRANVIDNFTQGRLDADFMPSFDDFSLWDDVVHPFFLSIGVWISSFGAFFLVAIIGVYLIFSAASEQMKKFNNELTRVPGTPLYAPDRTAEQSKEVMEVLEKVKRQRERRMADQQRLMEAVESGEELTLTSPSETVEQEDLEKLLQEIRTKQLEQAAPAKPEDPRSKFAGAITSILHLAAPLVVLGMITFLWGAFYYPAACTVAGYTRSFMATINPVVGLDTIKRLGGTYVKILLMAFVLSIVAGAVTLILELLFLPFNLPAIGNVPALVVGSFATFYFSIVFSCILGYALFKSADRLKLSR